MKICTIICEYNPFHNGHLHHLRSALNLSKADAIVCIMSGNFVQRGEAAILNKHTRARHAILAGADAVIELPTPFATSNAEIFAKGGVKIASAIPSATHLCFGAELADKSAFINAATLLNNEPSEVSQNIKSLMGEGVSFAKARADAWKELLPYDLLSSPNNILGLEYTKAILSTNSQLDILPIQRLGGGYSDKNLSTNFSSATAIRQALGNAQDLKDQLPPFVLKDLPSKTENVLNVLEKYAVINNSLEKIARVCDCNEGLENALKNAALVNEPLSQTLTSARYTASRIRRIALQNLLGIEETLVRNALDAPLYLRVLAVKKSRSDVLSSLSESPFPLLVRPRDEARLLGVAQECYEKDVLAEKVYSLLYPTVLPKSVLY